MPCCEPHGLYLNPPASHSFSDTSTLGCLVDRVKVSIVSIVDAAQVTELRASLAIVPKLEVKLADAGNLGFFLDNEALVGRLSFSGM